ncbi:SCP2 sterol-binding domain-containing protein [Aquihabitans daechungensis]|uniref:SCP2 sterol-binding domain-containing protein n=1 Tax=Aquihabitans daechungensis TaxID=1052257 RepID=UPI003BA1882C
MTAYLSNDWLEEACDPAAEALAAAGGSATIGRIITGAPDGELRFTVRIADGVAAYEPGIPDDVDLSLTDTYANAVALLTGEADANALFMRGRTKVAGSTRVLFDLLASTSTDRFREVQARVATAAGLSAG